MQQRRRTRTNRQPRERGALHKAKVANARVLVLDRKRIDAIQALQRSPIAQHTLRKHEPAVHTHSARQAA